MSESGSSSSGSGSGFRLNSLLPNVTLSEKSSKLEYKGWYERIMNYLLCSNLENTVEYEFDDSEMKVSRLSFDPSPVNSKKNEKTKDNVSATSVGVVPKVSKKDSLIAYSVIISRLDNDLINQFSTIERGNAYALMHAIGSKFNAVNFLSKLKCRRDFNLIRMGVSESVSAYGARIKCAAHEIELSDRGVKIGETELIGRFLDGLPKEYDDLITGLIQGIDEISFDQFAEIIQTKSEFIKRRDANELDGPKSAFQAGRQLICWGCKKPGHRVYDCPDREGNSNTVTSDEKEVEDWKKKKVENVNFAVCDKSLF
jgi:hypothetical protein